MIELDWDNLEKTILHYSFFDPWTWDEYYATNAKRDAMLASVNHVVDIILDFQKGKHIPAQAMTHFRKAAAWDSPQRGVVVIVGMHTMLQALGNIMASLYPQATLKAPRPAKNLEDARQLITEIHMKRKQKNTAL